MTNVLFLSKNETFKEDVVNQINYHLNDFVVFEKLEDTPIEVIVVDEDLGLLKQHNANELKAPVIFLTTNESSCDIRGCQMIRKPLNFNDFLDLLKSSITIFENSDDGVLEFNNYVLYPSSKTILNKRNNAETKLTEKEVAIIKYLHKNKELVISKNELIKEVWEYAADVATHTVETHIYRLRQKVEQGDEKAQLINTFEGGYKLNA